MPDIRVLHIFPSFEVGGLQLRAVSVMKGLGPSFEHRIVSLRGGLGAEDLLTEDIDAQIVDLPEMSAFLPRRLWQIRLFLQKHAPDLVITHNWGSIEWVAASRLLKRQPVLHLEGGFGPEEAQNFLIRRILLRRCVLRGRYVQVSVPSDTLYEVATTRWKLPAAEVQQIPDGIDCDKFKTAEPADYTPFLDAWSPSGSRPVMIGTVAILRKEKNLGFLMSAFKEVVPTIDARLVIVGDGPERIRFEHEVEKLGLEGKVYFAGFSSEPETAHAAFDLFAITSTTEQTPNSVLQAMAAGKPIIGLEAGDIKKMVSAKNRPFIVAQGDKTEFARLLALLADDEELRVRLGTANQARALEEYSEEAMVRAYEKLIEGLVRRK